MATQICSLCNTELLDNLISCSGRCRQFFHYSCIGMSRTTFDGYKKVEGLRWQCCGCSNEIDGIWTKLDHLTNLVNEIKDSINLCGMVKASIGEFFSDNFPDTRNSIHGHTEVDTFRSNTPKKVSRRNAKRRNISKKKISSTPTENTAAQSMITSNDSSSTPTVILDSSGAALNNTIIPAGNNLDIDDTVRVAVKRTYLWLSGFHHETTTNQIIRLKSKTLNVRESDIICRSLKSSRRSYSEFDHVSFRVGLRSSEINDALSTDKWPKGTRCKLFMSKNLHVRTPVMLD